MYPSNRTCRMWLEQSFRQQYGCELLRERCWQFPFKLVLQDRNKRVILGKVQTLIQYFTCHALCFGVREPLRHSIAVSCESYVCPCGDKLRVLQSLGVMFTHITTPVRDKYWLRIVPIAYSFQYSLAMPQAYSRTTVCCQCRTKIHEEVMYGAMA